ncbi:ATP-binding cassette domain-containing protein [Paenibacillus gansuensis]|uniref:ATP-binding cassette domain-containing protein n=1 Tax=Paenibacillus gansuensis TaxID=306542 RepID=A0ABW5PCE1_9BACL
MLEVKQVTKKIDGRPILQNITFSLDSGSIAGLVGRNGAGKTTLLRTMAGILDPEQGSIQWNSVSVHSHPEVKRDMVYIADSTEPFHGYTAMELADLYQQIYPKFDRMYFMDLMERFKLPFHKKIRHFSKGMKALTVLILSFSTRASCILLDEPTNGIDAIVKKQVLSLLVEEVAESGVTVVISTHHLEELERIADTILLFKGTTVETIEGNGSSGPYVKLQVVFREQAPAALLSLPNVRVSSQVGRVYTLLIEDQQEETVRLFEQESPLVLERLPVRLEDLFTYKLGDEHHVE